MKRTFLNITVASCITMVAYIALYAFWGAILNALKNPTLKLFLVCFMTTAAFGFFLLYTSKIRKSVGEEEVLSDYREQAYESVQRDFQLVIKRESRTLITIVGIALTCFALNLLYGLLFDKSAAFPVTLLFAPICIFDSVIKIPFLGYALSAVLDCVSYVVFLLIYRKKKLDYWEKDRG
ncbi:MAG: hypothetical protein E7637_05465 [Ruminococcaceae bacterium]|nr:hypothetical protein [Oscillospiraceae bacterium]